MKWEGYAPSTIKVGGGAVAPPAPTPLVCVCVCVRVCVEGGRGTDSTNIKVLTEVEL